MDLTELRKQIDALDGELIVLLQRRMDISAQIAEYKRKNGLPVLDAGREAEKLDAIRAQCRPELAGIIAELYGAVFAASRKWQSILLEREENG